MSSWAIDPITGDYLQENGAPIPSEDIKYRAFNRLKIPRGGWLYAPDDVYGSDYHLAKKRFNGGDLGGLTDIGERALQPLIDDGSAVRVDVSFDSEQQILRNNAALDFNIVDRQGKIQELTFSPIGG